MSKWQIRLFCSVIALSLPSVGLAQVIGDPLNGLATLKDHETRRASSADANWEDGNNDWRAIPAGETVTIAELEGPGVITHIWNTIGGAERSYSTLLRVRMYWDGEEHPSVDVPLGDFFAAGHGVDVPIDSLPVRVTANGRARNCYWPMPFGKSAKITITNEGRQQAGMYYYVDWQKLDELPDDIAYFHAEYRQQFPTTMGQNYTVAEIEGRGHYVGTVLSVRALSPEWWGEGDDQFFIDGDTEPTLSGTGTEDYFCDAWGFVQQSGAYYGAPVWEGNETDGGRTSVYRWHIPDPITFKKSLRFDLEHKGVTFNEDGSIKTHFAEREDDFSSVAFWYQMEPHKPFPEMPVGYDRLPFDPSAVIEAEGQAEKVEASAGQLEVQPLPGRSGGHQLFWKPAEADQTLTVPFEIEEAGEYELLLLLTKSWDYGIYEIHLDGQAVSEPIDFYAEAITERLQRIPARELAAGRHELTFINKGKIGQSEGHFLGIDGLLLGRRDRKPE